MSIRLEPASQPITEDDAVHRRALEHASVPTLMMSIVHLTGDASLLRGPIRPQRADDGRGRTAASPTTRRPQVRAAALDGAARLSRSRLHAAAAARRPRRARDDELPRRRARARTSTCR